jgi:hypothetical protein
MTDKNGDHEPRTWKRWLGGYEPLWIVGLSVVILVVYGVTIYSYAHSDDFLLNDHKPFESAVW